MLEIEPKQIEIDRALQYIEGLGDVIEAMGFMELERVKEVDPETLNRVGALLADLAIAASTALSEMMQTMKTERAVMKASLEALGAELRERSAASETAAVKVETGRGKVVNLEGERAKVV